MSFEGFPDEGLVFYEGLEADNSKTYWTAHKAAYDAHVRAPLQALLEELAGGVRHGEGVPALPRRALQPRQDAVQDPPGRGRHSGRRGVGAWYVQISADGLHGRRRRAGGWSPTR